MYVTLLTLFCLIFHHVHGEDITNCASNIFEKCKLNEYYLSTLEIVDRELAVNRGKVDDYFNRQVCVNAQEEMINFKRCVFEKVGRHCWKWHGVFDSIRLINGEKNPEMEQEAKRYEQTFVILEYNLCGDNDLRSEYFDIRSCSHKRFTMPGSAFHERFSECLGSTTPNAVEIAMNKMELCVGHNHEYSCFVDSMLGDHCDRVKAALLRYADLHAGHAGMHADELNSIQFILQSAYSDHLRLPKHNECHLLMRRPVEDLVPTKVYYALLFLSIIVVGALGFHFRDDLPILMNRFFQ